MMRTRLEESASAVDALHQAEAMFLDANRRTDEFLATLGHEMRNPLSALSSALLVWPTLKNDPPRMEELRNIMQRQLHQLTRLADDLLDVARIAQGTLQLRQQQVELRQLIEGACEEVQPFIALRNHALDVRAPAESIMVYGDASRLLQVFVNLIQNAAKFTDQNGSLWVTVESQEGMAVVRVRDNGPGIEAHLLPAIFEGFPQVPGKRAAANDGLGIGLRLVKMIVELHGGAVSAHSEGLGRGSQFTVQLPVMSHAGHSEQPETVCPAIGQNGHKKEKASSR